MSISSDAFLPVDPVITALSEVTGGIRGEGPGRWIFRARSEQPLEITAQVEPAWVLMDAPLQGWDGPRWLQPGRLGRLLRANAGLRGGVKFAVAGRRRAARLRAEVPTGDESDPKDTLRNVCLGFEDALAHLCGSKPAPSSDKPESWDPADSGCSRARLASLCAEAGWEVLERPDGVVAVRLGVEEGFHQATVGNADSGSLSVWAELAVRDSWPSESWQALGAFLLQACAHLKTVRPAVRTLDSGEAAAGFEVVPGPGAGPEGLGRAFSALSAACNLTRKEVRALREEEVGKAYLAMLRGWSSKIGRADTNQAQSRASKRG